MKIALVHDVLNQLGGAEKVLENFLEIWPDAVVHTVFYDSVETESKFADNNKKISKLNHFPFAHKHPKLFLPLIPLEFKKFNFDDYDVVLSDSSAFAKRVNTGKTLHISYIHTPTRFLWTEPEYIDNQNYPWILRFLGKRILPILKKLDFQAAQNPKYLIANSKNVQERIRKFYNRQSVVIPPPVDTEKFFPDGIKHDYFFTASRLEPYKRIDLVVEVFNKLGWPLKIAGTGSNLEKLKQIAGANIEFLGRISEDDLRHKYSEAKAFIFPAEEDAGIVILESQACGTPVIAFKKGGALETIEPGKTGEFFNEQTVESLTTALQKFDATKYNIETIRQQVMQYDKESFQNNIKQFVEEKLAEAKT